MQAENLIFTLECLSGSYRNRMTPKELTRQTSSGGSSELRQQLANTNIRPLGQYSGEPIYKVSFYAENYAQIDHLSKNLGQEVNVVTFDNLLPGSPLIAGEVADKAINKGMTLKAVYRYFGIPIAQSIAFGDSMNDTEMLLAAGIGVAMGNSTEQVKKLADQVCECCAEDGIPKALSRFGLIG